MIRAVLAAAVAVVLGGCSNLGCSGSANGNYGAGECGIHTTFFASATIHGRLPPAAKS